MVTIEDNDPLPTITIDDATLIDDGGPPWEPDIAEFVVHLSHPSDVPVYAKYEFVDGTASEGIDYDYVLQVHGWNMSPGDKEVWGDTAYKRLYWQGFEGRFGVFNWPTYYDAQGPRSPEVLNFTYNPSEFVAYRSAAALENELIELMADYDTTTVIAHSMGNFVVGEALRLWALANPTARLVDTYIAMPAAVPSGAYGNNQVQPHTEGFLDYYGAFPGLAGYPTLPLFTNNITAAGKWVNIYNPADFALNVWNVNNIARATNVQSTIWPYKYSFLPNLGSGFWRFSSTAGDSSLYLTNSVGGLGPNAYEILAFFAQSRTPPLGARDMGTGNRWQSIPLTSLGYSESMPGGTARPNHSYEWHNDSQRTAPFWNQIIVSAGLSSTYGP
ncbi:MAG: alpha/beta hydrolase [Planctomycetia bacterium]|nr:alpha/beta hydrolase [Planctomycetia bacterium]